jgi:hypothetical protein
VYAYALIILFFCYYVLSGVGALCSVCSENVDSISTVYLAYLDMYEYNLQCGKMLCSKSDTMLKTKS